MPVVTVLVSRKGSAACTDSSGLSTVVSVVAGLTAMVKGSASLLRVFVAGLTSVVERSASLLRVFGATLSTVVERATSLLPVTGAGLPSVLGTRLTVKLSASL